MMTEMKQKQMTSEKNVSRELADGEEKQRGENMNFAGNDGSISTANSFATVQKHWLVSSTFLTATKTHEAQL